jgi:hypothetical protein
VRVYPRAVQCTDEMDLAQSTALVFDEGYAGFGASVLGTLVDL